MGPKWGQWVWGLGDACGGQEIIANALLSELLGLFILFFCGRF